MTEGKLQLWWIPQVPGEMFTVDVETPEEAWKIWNVLADYDLFQLNHNIKPDYSNAGGLRVWEDGEWADWYSEDGDEFREYFEEMANV